MDLTQKLTGVVIPATASVQVTGFKERTFNLNMDFSNCTIADVIALATKPRVITWANSNRSKGEDHMATLELNQTIMIQPVGTRGPVDVVAGFMSKMTAASVDDIDVQIKQLEAMKAKKATVLRKAKNDSKPE